MISDFETNRLRVRNWHGVLSSNQAPEWLEKGLVQLLTPNVLKHLPPSMQLEGERSDISDWVSFQAGEGDTFLVQDRHSGRLLGLLILASFNENGTPMQLHLGYLLAEETWGQGIATELVSGLVKHVPTGKSITVQGGVGRDNPGSAKVLQKAGFSLSDELSTSETEMYVLAVP